MRARPPVVSIFFSTKPAVLVLIDGKPALRQVPGSKLLRVLNTRALILLDQASGIYYLHLMDHWVQAVNVEEATGLFASRYAAERYREDGG